MLKLKREHIIPLTLDKRSREDLQAAVQSLHDNFISYVGPFVIKSGIAVFKVSDYLLSVDELIRLNRSGKLTEEGLTRFARDLEAAVERLAT